MFFSLVLVYLSLELMIVSIRGFAVFDAARYTRQPGKCYGTPKGACCQREIPVLLLPNVSIMGSSIRPVRRSRLKMDGIRVAAGMGVL